MLEVNGPRLLEAIEALAQIGRTPEGGVSRPALSAADAEGRAWFRARVEAAGLDFRQDGAGNLSAVLPASDPGAKTLLVGSHLDTVPNGGRFDGALGVLAALEALRTIREAELALPVHLEAIAFTDEEGALVELLGSRAMSGQLTAQDLAQPRGGTEALAAGMAQLGLSSESILGARRDPGSLLAFVELHIEQGTRLEAAGLTIGVVTAIVGIRSYRLRFTGEAAHAGTMLMPKRADALWGASAFILAARERIMARFAPGVMNCGQVFVSPGAFNIVPGRVQVALEFRHNSSAQLDAMESALLALAEETAKRFGLTLSAAPLARVAPAPMARCVIDAIEQAAEGLGHMRLPSFAGHDAQAMSRMVPAGMVFVPSVGGISHNPHEHTHPKDLLAGANVLLNALLVLGKA